MKSQRSVEKVKSEYINPEQFKFILDLMQKDNANAVRVCLITGLRIGDVLALKRENLSSDGTIYTICDKTDKPFVGEIPIKLAREILWRAGESEFLFPSPSPRSRGKPRTRQAVWRDIKRAAKICAVPRNVTPHSARKIYAVDKFHKEGLQAAQISLQHDRLETTLLYAYSDQIAAESKTPKKSDASGCRSDLNVDQILDRFFEAFGGREAFAEALSELLQ